MFSTLRLSLVMIFAVAIMLSPVRAQEPLPVPQPPTVREWFEHILALLRQQVRYAAPPVPVRAALLAGEPLSAETQRVVAPLNATVMDPSQPTLATWEMYNAFVIDRSAAERLGPEARSAVYAAYRRGAAVVGIGFDIPDMAAITGDGCRGRGFPSMRELRRGSNFLLIYHIDIQPLAGADLEAIYEAELRSCDDAPAAGGYSMRATLSVVDLDPEGAQNELVQVISRVINPLSINVSDIELVVP